MSLFCSTPSNDVSLRSESQMPVSPQNIRLGELSPIAQPYWSDCFLKKVFFLFNTFFVYCSFWFQWSFFWCFHCFSLSSLESSLEYHHLSNAFPGHLRFHHSSSTSSVLFSCLFFSTALTISDLKYTFFCLMLFFHTKFYEDKVWEIVLFAEVSQRPRIVITTSQSLNKNTYWMKEELEGRVWGENGKNMRPKR